MPPSRRPVPPSTFPSSTFHSPLPPLPLEAVQAHGPLSDPLRLHIPAPRPAHLKTHGRQPSHTTVQTARTIHSTRTHQTQQTQQTQQSRQSRRSHAPSAQSGTTYGEGTSLFGFIHFAPAPIITLPTTYSQAVTRPLNEFVVDPRDENTRKNALLFERLRKELPPFSARHRKLMIAGLWAVMFLGGWNDASQGPLLPEIRTFYKLDYLSSGYIWITNFVGFLIAGLSNVWVTDHLGFGIAAPMATAAQGFAYALILMRPPYPIYLIAFIFNGFGQGFLDALVNGFTTRLPDAQTKLFLNGAWYAFGATFSPLVTTQFVSRLPDKVFFYYAAPLALAIVNITILISVFRFRTTDQIVRLPEEEEAAAIREMREKTPVRVPLSLEVLREVTEESEDAFTRRPSEMTSLSETTAVETFGPALPVATPGKSRNERFTAPDSQATPSQDSSRGGTESTTPEEPAPPENNTIAKMKRIYGNPLSHGLGLYVALYAGAQSTLSGWAATYLIEERHGSSSAGYVSTGIFTGMFLGRIFLLPVVDRLGKSTTVFLCTLTAITLNTLIWAIPNLFSAALCFSLMGFTFAPLAPCLTLVITEVVPLDLQPGTMAWTGSLGCFGAAFIPFLISAIADSQGPWIITPFLLAILSTSLILYTFFPRPQQVATEGVERE